MAVSISSNTTAGRIKANAALGLTMNPNDVDWDEIAEMTGDKSWSHENMRKCTSQPSTF